MTAAFAYPRVLLAPELRGDERLEHLLHELRHDASEVTRCREERHTRHLWLSAETRAGPLPLFIKVYRPPLKRNLLTPLFSGRARREFLCSRQAAARSLKVLPAIAYGERRRRGVVVDQFVAFRQLKRARSVARLLLEADDAGAARLEQVPRFAEALADLHRGGYLHLQASPRNLLLVRAASGRCCVWIDHPSGLFFRRSIWARLPALADVLQVFRSRVLLPSLEDRRLFLEHYAPGHPRFHRLALKLHRRYIAPSTLRRLLKVGSFWKGFR